jgi:hypothetical protein
MVRRLRDVAPFHVRAMFRNNWQSLDFHSRSWSRTNPAFRIKRTAYGRSIIDKPTQPQFSVRRYGGAPKREALSAAFRKFRDVDQSEAAAERVKTELLAGILLKDIVAAASTEQAEVEADAELAALYVNACSLFGYRPSPDILSGIVTQVLPQCDSIQAAEVILASVGTSRTLGVADKASFYSLVASTPSATAVLEAEGSTAACCATLTWLTEFLPRSATASRAACRDQLVSCLFTKLSASTAVSFAEVVTFVFSLICERFAEERPADGEGSGGSETVSVESFCFQHVDADCGGGRRVALELPPPCCALIPMLVSTLMHTIDQLFPLEAAGFFFFLLSAASQLPGYSSPTDAISATVLDTVDMLAHRLYVQADMVAFDVDGAALVLAAVAEHEFARRRYTKLPRSIRLHLAHQIKRRERTNLASFGGDDEELSDDRWGGPRIPFIDQCLKKIGLPPLHSEE